MLKNAVMPSWLQTIFDILGDLGIVLGMARWAYKHWGQIRRFSYVAIFGTSIGIAFILPYFHSPNPGYIPIGQYTTNLPAYGQNPDSIYSSWLLSFWVPFAGLAILIGVIELLLIFRTARSTRLKSLSPDSTSSFAVVSEQ